MILTLLSMPQRKACRKKFSRRISFYRNISRPSRYLQKYLHMRHSLLLFFLFSFYFSFSQNTMDENYKIYDTRTKQIVTLDKIITDCSNAVVLFFGEEHIDSPCLYL